MPCLNTKSHAISLFILSLTIFEHALCILLQQKEIIISVPTSGRTRLEDTNTLGYFVNTLPL